MLTLAAQAVGESAEPEPNEFLGRCLGVHRNAIEQEPFILATAIAAKCLGAHNASHAAGSRAADSRAALCLGISHGVPQMPRPTRWPSCST